VAFVRDGKPVYLRDIATIRDAFKDPLTRSRINREKLSREVFAKKAHLSRLCKIIHPAVVKDIKGVIKKSGRHSLVVDAPLLIEAGLTDIVDKIIVVSASRINQIKRIKQKTNLCRKDIQQRIKAQLPLAKKKRMADFIVCAAQYSPHKSNVFFFYFFLME